MIEQVLLGEVPKHFGPEVCLKEAMDEKENTINLFDKE